MVYLLRSPAYAFLLILASLPLDAAAAAVLAAQSQPPPAAAAMEERLQRIAAAWREGAGADGPADRPGDLPADARAGVFVNGPGLGVGFSNGGFRNGGFYNGGFRNGGWTNGNAGWRNHW